MAGRALSALFLRPRIAAGHVWSDEVALLEVAGIDGKIAAVRKPVDGVEPAGRLAVFVKVEGAAFVGDQMAAHAASLALAEAVVQTSAHIAGPEHVQEEAPHNTSEQNQANQECLGRKRYFLFGYTHNKEKQPNRGGTPVPHIVNAAGAVKQAHL